MNAQAPRDHLRLVEDPLGADAVEPLSRAELLALWDEACRLPVPDYSCEALKRLARGWPA